MLCHVHMSAFHRTVLQQEALTFFLLSLPCYPLSLGGCVWVEVYDNGPIELSTYSVSTGTMTLPAAQY